MLLLCLNMRYSIFISRHWCLYLEEEKSKSSPMSMDAHWHYTFIGKNNLCWIWQASLYQSSFYCFFKVLYVLIKVNSFRKRGRDPQKIVWNKFERYNTYYIFYCKYYFKALPQTNISYATDRFRDSF